ncbi:poly [ADP-ribose] polymerase 2-like [Brevipalpus obovatus]|uniref:poly [ADP-ribose] polymerase 2-like n=1 Tax=Brevipalpus obovatus TaxID=246614 RepID=UPI003D9FA530
MAMAMPRNDEGNIGEVNWNWVIGLPNLDPRTENLITFLHNVPGNLQPLDGIRMVEIYRATGHQIKPLESNQAEYEIIGEYFMNTRYTGNSENKPYNPSEIMHIFKITSLGENHWNEEFLTNRKLLWHGTPSENILGILTHGFRTHPDYGICFSETSPMAAFHCRKDLQAPVWDNIRFILLCEVTLGESETRYEKIKDSIPPPGPDRDSTHCVGRLTPLEWRRMNELRLGSRDTFPDGDFNDCDYMVPWGRWFDNGDTSLNFQSEYRVYNGARIKVRYIVQCKVVG